MAGGVDVHQWNRWDVGPPCRHVYSGRRGRTCPVTRPRIVRLAIAAASGRCTASSWHFRFATTTFATQATINKTSTTLNDNYMRSGPRNKDTVYMPHSACAGRLSTNQRAGLYTVWEPTDRLRAINGYGQCTRSRINGIFIRLCDRDLCTLGQRHRFASNVRVTARADVATVKVVSGLNNGRVCLLSLSGSNCPRSVCLFPQ